MTGYEVCSFKGFCDFGIHSTWGCVIDGLCSQLSYTPMRKEYINRRGRECQEEFLKNRKNQEFLWVPQKDEKCTCGAEANAL